MPTNLLKVIFVCCLLLGPSKESLSQSNWPCPRCPNQVFIPDTNSAPYTAYVQDPVTKCRMGVTYRNIICDLTPPCNMMYLESIYSVENCCDLDDIQANLKELVDLVTRQALLTDPVTFSLGNSGECARVYKKKCWIKPTSAEAHGCDTQECCYAERNGTTITYQAVPLPDPACVSLPGCANVCKSQP